MTWLSRFVGRLIIVIALKGHFFGQIPQPIQRDSERKASRESGVTSIPANFPKGQQAEDGASRMKGGSLTELATAHDRARLLALLATFLELLSAFTIFRLPRFFPGRTHLRLALLRRT